LPEVATSFVGRDAEIGALLQMLDQPECRLVTIVAPGGSGKTRLAVEVGSLLSERSGLPVVFVNLEPHSDGDAAAMAIGDAFGVTLPRIAGDGDAALVDALREKQALLILDNFEHLAETCSEAIARIASQCPELRLLVTSRVALNVQQEWRFSLDGLAVQAAGAQGDAAAVRLFLDRARRVSGRADAEFDISAVREICRVVEGMPLAIEMAAAWSRSLSETDIAREIGGRLDILTTAMRDLPERQKSIAVVFDQSLAMLDEQLRQVFLRLGVFGGSFGRGAAVEIAGASLPTLATLVDHSLLGARAEGRYRLHSLLRSYARSALDEAGQLTGLERQHSRYYLSFAAQRLDALLGAAQRAAMSEMTAEYENLSQGWRYATEQRLLEPMAESAIAYAMFLDATARYQEGLGMADDLLVVLDASGGAQRDVLAKAHILRAGFHIRLGNLDEAAADCRACHELRNSGAVLPVGIATNELALMGLVELVLGNYAAARDYATRGGTLAGEKDALGQALAHYVAAGADFGSGDYAGARGNAERGLQLAASSGDTWFSGYIHLQLAEVGLAQGMFDDAAEHARLAKTSREQFGDRQGVALATLRLGDVAFAERDHDLARQHYLQALQLYRETADKGGRATAVASLANVDAETGDDASARTRYLQALEGAREIGYASALAQVFMGVATLQSRSGDAQGAAVLLAYLVRSATTPRATRDAAAALRGSLNLPAARLAEAERNAAALSLEGVCAAVTRALQRSGGGRPSTTSGQATPRVHELTQREVQVLALLDRGGTNSSVARELGLTTNTVKWYCTQIFAKLDAPNRTAALARARDLGLLA
jgi:predicted ATPase/DNA-binding NarL/FixJ family response regulator